MLPAAALAACGSAGDPAQAQAARQGGATQSAAPQLGAAQPAAADTGRFVAHDEHIQPGLPLQRRAAELRNPHEGDSRAAEAGSKLFIAYNCMDCHGADGSGAMGPSLQDGRWHFGGSPGEVFQSIYEGRPEGMPAWGGRIADDQIWMLVSYVRSLSAGKNVSTENFQGRTVERTGH